MNIRIIGAHGGVAPGYQTSCYEINHRFLIDCGSACSSMTPQEQFQVTDIFITHPHLDHIKDICFILENTFEPERSPLVLRSLAPVLNDVHKHMLNDVIWPDFSKIFVDKSRSKVLLKFEPIQGSVAMDDLTVTPFPVNHPGHACGYLIDDGHRQVIFTGDTGSHQAIWKLANSCSNLKAIFTEITFPSRMAGLAKASGHFTLQSLLDDLELLKHPVPIYISHFKPLYLKELLDEFYSQAPENIKLLHEDDRITIS